MSKIRVAGAQLPCSDNLDKNIADIKDAIVWASKNKVDYLLTPEGSLSGYFPDFDTRSGRSIQDVYAAENDVVQHATKHQVGLCLGTMWGEEDNKFVEGYRRENQIRFYSKAGEFLGSTNKTLTIPEYDQTVISEDIKLIDIETNGNIFSASGLICNDFWGGPLSNKKSLPIYVKEDLNAQIIFHATNGFKGELPNYDEITNAWHEGNLRMMSYILKIPIITVDSCYKMNGEAYTGSTSSQSGILLYGMWKVKAPRQGIQYFYYDFDYQELINSNLNKNPDQEQLDLNPFIGGTTA